MSWTLFLIYCFHLENTLRLKTISFHMIHHFKQQKLGKCLPQTRFMYYFSLLKNIFLYVCVYNKRALRTRNDFSRCMKSDQSCFHRILQMWKNLRGSLFSCFDRWKKQTNRTQSRIFIFLLCSMEPRISSEIRLLRDALLHSTKRGDVQSVCAQAVGRTFLWLFTGKTTPPWDSLSSVAKQLTS